MPRNNTFNKVFANPILYVLIGTLTSIAAARIYVFLGGAVTLTFDGIYLHHLFYGVIIIVAVGILSFLLNERTFRSASLKNVMALAFGFGLGLVIDESNLLILTGQEYSLSLYYSAYNTIVEFVVILLLITALAASIVLQTLLANHRKKR